VKKRTEFNYGYDAMVGKREKTVNFRATLEQFLALQVLARENNRSVSAMVSIIVNKHLQEDKENENKENID
jgi:hypothetical protein